MEPSKKTRIAELVRTNNGQFRSDASAAEVALRNAAWKAHDVWGNDFDNPKFQRSMLAQLPFVVSPDAPKLKPPIDIFDVMEGRFYYPHPDFFDPVTDYHLDNDCHQGRHAIQAGAYALARGWNEEVVLGAFLHDFGKLIRRQKHSFFSAEMMKPYVSEKIYWMLLWHFDVIECLEPDAERIRETSAVHPTRQMKDIWYNRQAFQDGPRSPNRVDLDLQKLKDHPWYKELSQLRQADDEGRIPHYTPSALPELRKIVARHFKLPKQGLGWDGSSASEYWKLVVEGTWMT